MDSQKLVDNAKTILWKLYLNEKISSGQYRQLEQLILEIRVKSCSEWIMNDIAYTHKKTKV